MHLTGFAMRRLEGALESGRILRYLVAGDRRHGRCVRRHHADRRHEDFPSLGLALWWAVMTVTTVGYGDIVPVQPAGRAVASVLMIIGYSSLSLLTGIVASVLVRRRSQAEEPPVGFGQLDRRLAEIERLLQERAE